MAIFQPFFCAWHWSVLLQEWETSEVGDNERCCFDSSTAFSSLNPKLQTVSGLTILISATISPIRSYYSKMAWGFNLSPHYSVCLKLTSRVFHVLDAQTHLQVPDDQNHLYQGVNPAQEYYDTITYIKLPGWDNKFRTLSCKQYSLIHLLKNMYRMLTVDRICSKLQEFLKNESKKVLLS